MPGRVFVTRQAPEEGMRLLREAPIELVERAEDSPCPRERLLEELRASDVVIAFVTDRIDRAALGAGDRLRGVANCAVGFDHVDVPAATERGIWVTNTPGVLTDATAELTWALILAAARRVGEGERLVRAGQWQGWSPVQGLGLELRGRTLGIVGPGRIGSAVARIGARGFGMPVLYAGTRAHPELEAELGARRADLDSLLSESDVVSLHAPLTPATRGLIGRDRLARMRPGSVLVNTARGPLIDEEALAEALRTGRPGAAGLDVYTHEPRIPESLRAAPQVVLLPHFGSATRETRGRMMETAARNALAVLRGERPPNPVNSPPPRADI